MPTIKIGGEEFEELPKAAVAGSAVIERMYKELGKPTSPFSTSGKKMMEIIIAVWEDLWPVDAKIWLESRKEYQSAELSISQQVARKTGRSLASYPLPVYNIMRKVFKGFDPAERKNCLKMVKYWPMFRMANRA